MVRKIHSITKNFPFLSRRSKIYFFLRFLVIPFEEIDKILPKKGLIIDLGCGNGPLTSYLALSSKNRLVKGWDIDEKRMQESVKISKTIKNLKFEKKNPIANAIPKVDAVLASDFLHHISYSSQEKVLEKIYQVLKPQGVLLIKEVDKEDFPKYFGSFIFDHLFYPKDTIYFRSKKDWTTLLEGYGFKVSTKKALFWFPASTNLLICTK